MVEVSVIIVTYNSERTIKSCLESIGNFVSEIFVVDNNSTDRTLEEAKRFGNAKVIENSANLGVGGAVNQGVKASKEEYILLLNPDAQIMQNSIIKLTNYMDQNKEAAVVGPKLLNPDKSLQREMAKFPTLLSQILILLRLHRTPVFKEFVYQNYDYEKTQKAEHLMGSVLLIRRTIFQKVGGFDEKFFLWFEETDLLKRIKEVGYKVIYYPKAIAVHQTGQSTKQLSFWKRQTVWNRSLIYYFQKHKTWLHILVLLPFLLLSYPAAFLASLVRRKS